MTNNSGASQTRTHNLQNQEPGVGGVTLSFETRGNTTVDGRDRTLVWDAWNRLIRVQIGSTTLVQYKYDGLKRRIVEQPEQSSARHHYYSDQREVIEERIVTSGGSPNTAPANIQICLEPCIC